MLSPDALRRAPKRLRMWALTCAGAAIAAAVVAFTAVPTPASVHAAGPLEVGAWGFYGADNVLPALASHADEMTEVVPFFFTAKSATDIGYNGNVSKTRGDSLLQSFKDAAAANGKPLIASIADTTGRLGMASIIADPASRTAHVNALVNFAGGFSGIDLDYESFAFSDGQGSWPTVEGVPGTYDNWGAFLTELSTALHANGKTLQVSVPPIYDGSQTPKSGYWVYNFPVMANVVDRIKVMMYSYSVSQPGPNAPYDWVSKTMTFMKTVVPAAKLQLGIPAYGSDWVTKVDGACPAQALLDKATAKRSLTTINAAQAAANKGQVPTRNTTYRENTYSYVESYSGVDGNNIPVLCNVYRTVWYDDEQAIYERALLAKTLGLAGVTMWALGYESESVWDAINAVQTGGSYTPPAPLAPSVKSPAVLAPYPQPINAAGPLPARYLDTRKNYTTSDGLFQKGGTQPADSTIEVPIAGRGPVPGGTTTVILNVTALGVGTGYVTVYPCGNRPLTSSLNVRAGQTISNSVITKLSAGGTVCVYTQQPADLIIDVFSVVPTSAVTALDTPARLLDTRAESTTIDGQSVGTGALGVNGVVEVKVAGRGGVSQGAQSAVLNVTAVNAVGDGYLTVYPCDKPRPTASNVNYAKSAAIPNAVIAALSATGTVCVYSSNTTDVIIDVFAQLAANAFDSLDQAGRLLDTRQGFTTIDNQYNGVGKSDVNQVSEIPIGGRASMDMDPSAAVLNVTVVAPETAGYITVYACGTARPPVSSVNFAAGQTIPNLVVTALSPTGTVCVYSSTKTHILIDVFGSLSL